MIADDISVKEDIKASANHKFSKQDAISYYNDKQAQQ